MIRRSLLSLVAALMALVGLPAILATTAAAAPSSGYWMLGQGGTIYQFGAAAAYGPATIASGAKAVKIESKADGTGIWVVDSKGNVSAFGTAVKHSTTAPTLNAGETIVTMARTATGNGYWLVSSSGRTFNYGDAIDVGDVTDFTPNNVPLNKPVIDAAKAVTGNGMYLVAEDGGVFTMGDAIFYGSTGNLTLNSPVKSLVPDPDGVGYWLIAGDGGVFSFDATFRGSMGSTPLNGPVVGMVSFGNGYLQVGSDGGIFNFSNLDFFGSLGGNPPAIPIVSVAAFSAEANTSPTMTISTTSLAAATQGAAYSATVAAANSTGTVTWSATGLPTGMSISSSTGAITGRPSCLSGTTASVTVTATDTTGTANRTLSLAVNALPYKGDFTSGESTAEIKRITNDAVGLSYLSRASLSNNGCMVAFEDRSAALANTSTLLGTLPDVNTNDDIFVLDRGSGVVRRITSGTAVTPVNGWSAMPSLSADGRYLAFDSHATNFDSANSGGIFYVDLLTNTTTRVAPGPASDGQRAGSEVQISGDGSHVVYSASSNSGPPFHTEVYLWRKSDGHAVTVSHAATASAGTFADGNGDSYNASVNTDGTVVAFSSTATDIVAGADNNTVSDIFVWTGNGNGYVAAPRTTPTTADTGDIQRVTNGDSSSNWPYISADGSRIAFVTYATDIDTATRGADTDTTRGFGESTNINFEATDFPHNSAVVDGGAVCGVRDCNDIYTKDADVAFATRPGASWTNGGTLTRVTNGSNGSFLVGASANGGLVVFDSHDATPAASTGDVAPSPLGSLAVFSQATATPSVIPSQMVPFNLADQFLDEQKARPVISGDGRYVLFQSNDSDPSTLGHSGETDANSGNSGNLNWFDFYLLARSAT